MLSADTGTGHKSWIIQPLRMPLNIDRLHLFLAIIIFRLIIDYSYVHYISPVNELDDWLANQFVFGKWLQSWFIMLVTAAFLPTRTEKPSDFLIVLFFFMPFLPQISLYAFLNADPKYAYATWLSFMLVALARNLPITVRIPEVRDGRWIAVSLCGGIVVLLSIIFYVSVGTGSFQLNFLDVYESRQEVSGRIGSIPLLGYIGPWTYKVCNPFLIGWSLLRRKYLLTIALLGAQVFFFGIINQKAVVFFPLFVFAVFWFARERTQLARFSWLLTVIVVLGMLEELVTHTMFWNQFIVRRIIWIPARLDWMYYDFFTQFGIVRMSDSVFKSIVQYPFQIPPQSMIGLFWFGRADMNADTGFLATSYMHFGFAGMIVFSLLVGVLLRVTDAISVGRIPVWLALAAVVGPFFNLFCDSDLMTTIATHGLAVAMLLIAIYAHRPQATHIEAGAERPPP